MNIVKGGFNTYGFTVGIMMLDTKFPRIAGDIGHADTFDFPVLYQTVEGATPQRLIVERDPTLLQPFIEAGQELFRRGVKILTTSCGFLAMFHQELAKAFPIPVFTSSLLQIPLIYSVSGFRRVGVLTANSEGLTDLHFESVGATKIPIAIQGIEDTHFGDVMIKDKSELDVDQAEKDMVEAARKLVTANPDIGAIVLECTNMPPYAPAVRLAVSLPVFDIINMVNLAYRAV